MPVLRAMPLARDTHMRERQQSAAPLLLRERAFAVERCYVAAMVTVI